MHTQCFLKSSQELSIQRGFWENRGSEEYSYGERNVSLPGDTGSRSDSNSSLQMKKKTVLINIISHFQSTSEIIIFLYLSV